MGPSHCEGSLGSPGIVTGIFRHVTALLSIIGPDTREDSEGASKPTQGRAGCTLRDAREELIDLLLRESCWLSGLERG